MKHLAYGGVFCFVPPKAVQLGSVPTFQLVDLPWPAGVNRLAGGAKRRSLEGKTDH